MAEQNQIGDTDKMVSAVQFLANKLPRGVGFALIPWIEEAKELEKQQHGVTWDAAIKAHDDRGHVHARSLVDFDDYYNETFKK